MGSSAILDRIHTLLSGTPPFDGLSEAEEQDLLADLSVEYFEPGEVIIEQGSTTHRGLFVVESGLVRLMDVAQQHLIDKCGEGDVFGTFGLLKGGAAIYEAKAVEPTVCAVLSASRFQQLYEERKEVAAFFDSDVKWYLRRQGTTVDVTGAYLLFSRRVDQLVHRQPLVGNPELTAREAAQRMTKSGAGAVLIREDDAIVGIVTDSDLRVRLVATGRPLDTPVRAIMSSPVVTIPARATLFDAMMQMLDRGVRRLVVLKEDQGEETPIAVLTQLDLVHFRGLDPVATVTRLEHVTSVAELADIRAELNEHLLRLYRQGVPPEMLGHLAAVMYDRIAVRVLQLVEHELVAATGPPPGDLSWAWIRLGSSGRQEMALNSTQHNAVLYAIPPDEATAVQAERWFDTLADRVNVALEACGFTMSEVVARDPRWRMSLRAWRQAYRTWIFEASEQALAHAPIFFDVRGIYGDRALVDALLQDVEDALNVQEMDQDRQFLRLLAARALANRPPLSFFRRFVLERSGEHRRTLDIRAHGILPVVDAARLLALETRYVASMNTFDRLRHAADVVPELAALLGDVLDAYQYLVDFRLEHQLSRVRSGEPPNNHIDPASLTKVQQRMLRGAFATVADLQKRLEKRYEL